MNANKKSLPFIIRLALAIIAIILIVNGAKSFASTINPRSGPVSVTVIGPETPVPTSGPGPKSFGPLVIDVETNDLECGADGKVISASIDLKISGGVAPYYLEFDPSDVVISDIQAQSTVRFVLEGGKTLTVMAKSNTSDGKPMDARDIRAPSTDSQCHELTSTGLPTMTSTSILAPTSISINTKSRPTAPTVLVYIPTNTPEVSPSNTSVFPTNTEGTSFSTPTVSTSIAPSSTSAISTNTPVPTATLRHLFVRECNDGIDNDGDGHIDLNDPECRWGFDNHEDK